ncbi:uncharacterized protein EDB91DRAFT_1088344 [Suillus paluster]|uniref:uncharacterized protein n=1 Tax=Suillus paluster TaxID=48578 RepID=UPI001B87D8F3|nr:uncharacterized protein EDB91DRAFT_1088344 [Suillus paluster]KAG1721828.1 hypothetical protein EDB91DRAFT_1088344 [Suillus paluster]
MAIAIRQGAAQIALLEDRVAEQDGKIDTLQRLHEGLRREIMVQHPSFPLPDPPANASSLLLDQSSPPTISPTESAPPPLIDLTMEGIAPTTATATVPDASAIDGLPFDYNQVAHPEDPDASGKIVDPGDPSNLVPEYNSSDDMDVEVEVKVEESSEEYRDPTPEIRYSVLGDSCVSSVLGCQVSGVGTRLKTQNSNTQITEYRVPNLGCWYSVLGTRYSGVGCWVLGVGCRYSVLGTWVSGVGCQVLGVGCRYSI